MGWTGWPDSLHKVFFFEDVVFFSLSPFQWTLDGSTGPRSGDRPSKGTLEPEKATEGQVAGIGCYSVEICCVTSTGTWYLTSLGWWPEMDGIEFERNFGNRLSGLDLFEVS